MGYRGEIIHGRAEVQALPAYVRHVLKIAGARQTQRDADHGHQSAGQVSETRSIITAAAATDALPVERGTRSTPPFGMTKNFNTERPACRRSADRRITVFDT